LASPRIGKASAAADHGNARAALSIDRGGNEHAHETVALKSTPIDAIYGATEGDRSMRSTINIDDRLMEKARSLTGTKETAAAGNFRACRGRQAPYRPWRHDARR
jgi:hypothetical protein